MVNNKITSSLEHFSLGRPGSVRGGLFSGPAAVEHLAMSTLRAGGLSAVPIASGAADHLTTDCTATLPEAQASAPTPSAPKTAAPAAAPLLKKVNWRALESKLRECLRVRHYS